jgi:hypothetical protein
MNQSWAKRIHKLEVLIQAREHPPARFRYGSIKRLVKDASIERHVAVSKSEPTALPNVDRCEFEERAGPAPVLHELDFNVYLNLEDEHDTSV